MTRGELQQPARMRLREAAVLLRARQYSGAYYLCGYAVECALKACIAKRTRRYEFPDKPTADRAWTHDPERLLRAAGLEDLLKEAMIADEDLEWSWTIVKDWNEASRYERHTAQRAQNLYRAVSDNRAGVLPWLQQHW
ncbi:MAG: HEPN domain-containing protein [Dehalococcoidia bacterium]